MREGYILPFNLSDGDGITPPPSKDRGSFTPEQTHVLPPLYPRGLFKTCRLGSGTWVLSHLYITTFTGTGEVTFPSRNIMEGANWVPANPVLVSEGRHPAGVLLVSPPVRIF